MRRELVPRTAAPYALLPTVRFNARFPDPAAGVDAGNTPTGRHACWHRHRVGATCPPQSARTPFGKSGVNTTGILNSHTVARRPVIRRGALGLRRLELRAEFPAPLL